MERKTLVISTNPFDEDEDVDCDEDEKNQDDVEDFRLARPKLSPVPSEGRVFRGEPISAANGKAMLNSEDLPAGEDSEQPSTHTSKELEFEGYLQRRDRLGWFRTRFFQTRGHTLQYFTHGKESMERGDPPTAIFDIREITDIKKGSGLYQDRTMLILFATGDKFRLELRAVSEESMMEWQEILLAKRALYSKTELLEALDASKTTFKTSTFASLLVLCEKDQTAYLVSHIDELFEAAADDARTFLRRNDPVIIISAARKCVDELLRYCDDCLLEISGRNPQVVTHCRAFMHRYSNLVAGRLVLELSFYFDRGSTEGGRKRDNNENGEISRRRRVEEVGERGLCAAASLMSRIELLRSYPFLPHDLVSSLHNCLLPAGELISAILNLALEQFECWFQAALLLPPIQFTSRLRELDKLVLDIVSRIELPEEDFTLHKELICKTTTSVLLAFSDGITSLQLDRFDESSLISYIHAANDLTNTLSSLSLPLKSPTTSEGTCRNNSLVSESEKRKEGEIEGAQDVRLSIPSPVLEACKSALVDSSMTAVITGVYFLPPSLEPLIQTFFCEGNVGWIGGSAVTAYVDRIQRWCRQFCADVPDSFRPVVKAECVRVGIQCYLQSMIGAYSSGKTVGGSAGGILLGSRRRGNMSSDACKQLLSDLECLYSWTTSSALPADVFMESSLLRMFIEFITFQISLPGTVPASHANSIPRCFATGIQNFGLQYDWHIYDLLRLALKLRCDVSEKERKLQLGICAEFAKQLRDMAQSDSCLFNGVAVLSLPSSSLPPSHRPQRDCIFDILCRNVGNEHCTGAKWTVEILSDPMSVRVEIAKLVNDVYECVRAKRNASTTSFENPAVDNSQILTESPPLNQSSDNASDVRQEHALAPPVPPAKPPKPQRPLPSLSLPHPDCASVTTTKEEPDSTSVTSIQVPNDVSASSPRKDAFRRLLEQAKSKVEEAQMAMEGSSSTCSN